MIMIYINSSLSASLQGNGFLLPQMKIFLPRMLLLKPKQLLYLRIRHRRLKFPHSPRDRRIRKLTTQKLLRPIQIRDTVIGGIEDLKAQSRRPQRRLAHPAQIARIGV